MTERQTKPIRILHVLAAMNRAGAETMLMNLFRVIDRERIQFDFAVTATRPCDYDDEIIALGGRIIHYPRYRGWNHLAYRRWWDAFFRAHPEYQIVHGHIGSTASIYLSIAKKHGRYAIAHSHSIGGMNLHDMLYRVMSFSTRYIADYFFGCSKDALVCRYGRGVAERHEISRVLKNGIDVGKYLYTEERCRNVRSALGLKRDALVIGTVGRFVDVKNPFFIVDILEALKSREPDFRFLWAGTGPLKDRIEARIAQKGLRENVLLLGMREDIPEILQTLNAFILPSKYEGLPVIGVEVQAAGVPMLLSDRIPSEIRMSKCATFLPIDSPKPWAEGILRERAFRRVSDASADVIRAGYDVRTTSKWLMAFYEERLGKNTARDAGGEATT